MVLLWVVIAAVFLVGEAITNALFAVFVAVGAGGAALAAAAGSPVWIQLVVVAALPAVGLMAVRPALVRNMGHSRSETATAVGQGLIGHSALTLDQVGDEHHPGHVTYAGERWLAVTDSPGGLPPDSPVTIVAVRGTTLVVWP